MQVNVFISAGTEENPPKLLVLPLGPEAAIPRHLQGTEWRHFATTMTDDRLLGARAADIEADIAANGYALVAPTG
ncbi:hypothetical protein [uncultured Devosia sp.]|mgnify:CR=1 FL=1|uniref:hypothetical protein n=1 Tax=uncultured Devosia sp. TaxID=211434 RepID=UPI00260C9621|nr:hypothetical protein [uncultured Devosia sp.]